MRSALPSTAQLLTQGGDARVALDERGANRYGCRPYPDAELLAFGSATSSVISEAGYAAADSLRHRLQETTEPQHLSYARELGRVRHELLQLCGLDDLAGLECVFAASGTDIHFLASQLSFGSNGLVLMPEAAETGSGVPAALGGDACRTAGRETVEVAAVKLRNGDGTLRDTTAVEAEIESRAAGAAAEDRPVLLVLTDVSKSGLVAPGVACVDALQERFPGRIEVLVDACQFRLAPATLRAYLERGFMVALTGSKFVGGPSFSGALLVPVSSARRLRWRTLPAALSACCSRAEWPSHWAATEALAAFANFGLLLRWEAALQELRMFRMLPETGVEEFFREFAQAVQQRLQSDPAFEPLDVPALDRGPLSGIGSWDREQTLFPFLLRNRGRVLDATQMRQVYRMLQTGDSGLRCQLGQPVNCGTRDGVPLAALRLCLGARQAVEALQDRERRELVTLRAMVVLSTAAAIAERLPD